MQKEIKQVAWGYMVGTAGVRAGAQDLEELNQMLNTVKQKGTRRANGKATIRAKSGEIKQK